MAYDSFVHVHSGTDSPYRETSNITDGSTFTADMAVQVSCLCFLYSLIPLNWLVDHRLE